MDRRISRTRQLLQSALIDLSVEGDYQSVTAQQILDRAGVARSTFYAHYRDKEALLKGSIDNLHGALRHHWNRILSEQGVARGELSFVLFFLEHVGASRHVYLALIGGERAARSSSATFGECSRISSAPI